MELAQDNKERDELLTEIEPNLSRLGEIEQGIIAKIKEAEECNSGGILFLKSVRNYLAKPEKAETETGQGTESENE